MLPSSDTQINSLNTIWPQILSHSALPASLAEFIRQFKLTPAYESLNVRQRLSFHDLELFVRMTVSSGELPSDVLYSYLVYFFHDIDWKSPS